MIENITSLKKLSDIFQSNNKKLYIVGGHCRDSILGIKKVLSDIDLSTNAFPNQTEKIIPCIKSIGKKYGTLITQHENITYEITSFRSDIGSINNRKPAEVQFSNSLDLDSQRRDFTCNAIYYDIGDKKYIDPQNGIQDIKDNIIRFIGDPQKRIHEDALRILRLIRIKNNYDFNLADENYFNLLKKNIYLLKNISKERIKDELDKILLGNNNIQALKDLKKIGFFTIYLQEIEKQESTPGSKYHQEGNVWIHTLMTLEYMNGMNNLPKERSEKLDLYWTMFLHDIAKPICYSLGSDGNGHYYGHERSGKEIFLSEVCSQLPFSKKSQKKISWIIENHLRVFKVFEMKKGKARVLMMNKYWKDLMLVSEADHMGRIPAHYELVEKLNTFYNNFIEILNKKKFMSGKDIIKKYPDLKGNEIGNKLKQVNYDILISDENE